MVERSLGSGNALGDQGESDFRLDPDRVERPGEARTTWDESHLLVEVICERVHCVMYDYAITTVDFVAEDYGDRVRVKPVVRRGSKENAERYLELCRINGRHLSVPTILIDGQVVFTDVPGPEELRSAVEKALAAKENS